MSNDRTLVTWKPGKPGLVNRDAVSAFFDLYGVPVCMCCKVITFDCLFRYRADAWRVYCINCGLTIDAVGICLHNEEIENDRINYYLQAREPRVLSVPKVQEQGLKRRDFFQQQGRYLQDD